MALVIVVRESDEVIVSSTSGNIGVGDLPAPEPGFQHHEVTNQTDLSLIQAKGLRAFTFNLSTLRLVPIVDNRAVVSFDQLLVVRNKGAAEASLQATRESGSQNRVRLALRGSTETFLDLDFSGGSPVAVSVATDKAGRWQIADSPQGRVVDPVDIIVTTPSNRVEV